ncbi:HutD family protein [Paraburkholderia sp.]|uniref:HutD/Ves family protein n=1 Tax=Paraburkholderia sp. TaxID=1926495 RepID=UPI00286EF0F9|nr:HutD family protein [Paraburkholderia sp.]
MSDVRATHAPRLTLLRGADLVASPWKNGGGVTREIAAESAPLLADEVAHDVTFAWRVSVADVAQAGPFSRFAGVDRTLVLLEGAGMLLDERDAMGLTTHALTRALDVVRFDGATPIDARLVDGATRDFNLMVRRDVASGSLDIWREAGSHRVPAQTDTVLLYGAQGVTRARIAGGEWIALETGDTLRIDFAQAAEIETQGEGALLAITLNVQRHSTKAP